MRSHLDPQSSLFKYFSMEERIPVEHPLRAIKAQAEAVLASMNAAFEAMYADGGRPSIAPECLFCEQLAYNMLFRWFLDMDLEAKAFDRSTFLLNRFRLSDHDIAQGFFSLLFRSETETSTPRAMKSPSILPNHSSTWFRQNE